MERKESSTQSTSINIRIPEFNFVNKNVKTEFTYRFKTNAQQLNASKNNNFAMNILNILRDKNISIITKIYTGSDGINYIRPITYGYGTYFMK